MQRYKGWIRYTKLEEKKQSTIGEQSSKLASARKDNTHCAQEQVDEELKKYPDEINECINNGKKHFDKDFYIQVLFCLDRVIEGAKKNIFVAQRTCPKPFFDQAVYKYHHKNGSIEFLWVVPDVDLCELYRYNLGLVPEDEKDLYKNIMDYYSGELAKREHLENKSIPKQVFAVTRS